MACREELEAAIKAIEEAGSDEDVDPTFLNYDGMREGYTTLAAGYWVEFVPAALWTFQEEIEEAGEEEEDEFEEELKLIESLQSQKNKLARRFIKGFFVIARSYENRHC